MKQRKEPTAKQLAAREKFAQAARERSKKKTQSVEAPPAAPEEDTTDFQEPEQDYAELKRQLNETNETMALLKAALLGGQSAGAGGQPSVGVGRGNKLIGEVEKYLVDPAHYPDPTIRLRKEPRLQPIAFDYNYELDYRMDIVAYETKTGVNMKEPKFHVTLNRIVRDGQGNEVTVINPKTQKPEVKRYIARRLVFHEDPQAAIVIARDNNIPIDESNEKQFLDEMRYLRVRDWLFDILWPQGTDEKSEIQEEVVGGTLVQFFTKSSEDPSQVEFDKLETKL